MFLVERIGNRLYVAFMLIFLFWGITTWIGWRQILKIQALSSRVAQDQWPKTVLANKIIALENMNGRDTLSLMLLNDPDDIQSSTVALEETSKVISGFYSQLDAIITNPDGREMLEQIDARRSAYTSSRKTVIELVLAGKREQAAGMLMNQTTPLQNVYLQAIYGLIAMQGKDMEATVHQID